MADVTLSLRSRKDGTGTAIHGLLGHAGQVAIGQVVHAESFAITGQVYTLAQGTMLYRGRATLSWNANSEPDVAGYQLWHGIVSTDYTEARDVGNVRTYVWNDLLPGSTHFFVLTAYDLSGNESLYSLEVSKGY